jgi:hypothetical protein
MVLRFYRRSFLNANKYRWMIDDRQQVFEGGIAAVGTRNLGSYIGFLYMITRYRLRASDGIQSAGILEFGPDDRLRRRKL